MSPSINLSTGVVSPFAGSGQQGSSDGLGSNATFDYPRGIAIDQETGNIFVSEGSTNLIRQITPRGVFVKTCCQYLG